LRISAFVSSIHFEITGITFFVIKIGFLEYSPEAISDKGINLGEKRKELPFSFERIAILALTFVNGREFVQLGIKILGSMQSDRASKRFSAAFLMLGLTDPNNANDAFDTVVTLLSIEGYWEN